ncbi:MAG TPA: MmcQ/YjbR family DNA-binding protein [Jatrophihabitantaceae bacterium]|jgi:predicted DNA-binding protein (MmcQ/YjbR family)
MRREDIVDYCLGKPGAWLDSPWGEGDSVVKVGDKIFCFYGGDELAIIVKNTREAVAEWRDRFPSHVGTAPYLNKQLWNRVVLEGSGCPDEDDMHELIDDSYDLVVASLPKSKRPL